MSPFSPEFMEIITAAAPVVAVVVPVAAALAAAFSAAMAVQANRKLTKTERLRRIREFSLLVRQISAAMQNVFETGEELKTAYNDLSLQQSTVKRAALPETIGEIEKDQKAIETEMTAMNKMLKEDLLKLSNDQIVRYLIKLDAHQIRVDRIRHKFDARLTYVQSKLEV